MKGRDMLAILLGMSCAFAWDAGILKGQEKGSSGTAEVHVVITDMALRSDRAVPRLRRNEVKVQQGSEFLQVTQLIAARGEKGALQLMILIDDTLDASSVGNDLSELKAFIKAQPSSTAIGIGYMSSATLKVAQQFTADHELAVKAVRLPQGTMSPTDSPYRSLMSAVEGWQKEEARRVVLMVTDGIDRLLGEEPRVSGRGPNFAPVYHSMPIISADASSASEVSQRDNVIVFAIYASGAGRFGRSAWHLQEGLGGLTKIAEETGGECYCRGAATSTSFKPYLERFQRVLDNQYYLVFLATPREEAGLQRVVIQTEVSNSEIAAPDNVWVPTAK